MQKSSSQHLTTTQNADICWLCYSYCDWAHQGTNSKKKNRKQVVQAWTGKGCPRVSRPQHVLTLAVTASSSPLLIHTASCSSVMGLAEAHLASPLWVTPLGSSGHSGGSQGAALPESVLQANFCAGHEERFCPWVPPWHSHHRPFVSPQETKLSLVWFLVFSEDIQRGVWGLLSVMGQLKPTTLSAGQRGTDRCGSFPGNWRELSFFWDKCAFLEVVVHTLKQLNDRCK